MIQLRRRGRGSPDCGVVEYWEGEYILDLSQVSFVEPHCLAELVVFAHSARIDGVDLAVTLPRDPDVAGYCQRMNLFQAIRELGFVAPDPQPWLRRHDRRSSLFECSRLTDPGSIEALANLVQTRLDDAHWPARVVDDIVGAIYEVCDNLITHAHVDHGYAVAQTFPRARRFQFAIGDAGVGIPHHHPAATDAASIREAMRKGVSRLSDKRGNGLDHLRKYMTEMGGSVAIRSHGGRVDIRATEKPMLADVSYLDGTIVSAEVVMPRR